MLGWRIHRRFCPTLHALCCSRGEKDRQTFTEMLCVSAGGIHTVFSCQQNKGYRYSGYCWSENGFPLPPVDILTFCWKTNTKHFQLKNKNGFLPKPPNPKHFSQRTPEAHTFSGGPNIFGFRFSIFPIKSTFFGGEANTFHKKLVGLKTQFSIEEKALMENFPPALILKSRKQYKIHFVSVFR